ncbi:replication-relaxation family protein [Streptomyces canus]|uniref:replication-relaxation family protein n=1 Tax=Streptomyces canus TaxID=58343 RepID=UPI00342F1B02
MILSRLSRLDEDLTSRERLVLETLAITRVATAEHIAHVVFGDEERATAHRLAHRHLQRLTKFGLVRRFANASSGRKSGPAGYVHVLTSAGLTLTRHASGPGAGQRRAWRPSPPKLRHWLAICDLYVRLVIEARNGGPAVRQFLVEADARRTYWDSAGRRRSIQPDALVRIVAGGLELSWFVEIDLATESPAVLANKCRAYCAFELSGLEQERHGIFPGVLFIVPGDHRARRIARVIADQPPEARGLFRVTTEAAALTALRTSSS